MVSPDLFGVATAGALAGFAKTMISHPLDTIKVHIQNQRPVPRQPRALYRGIAVPFVRNGIEHSTHFFFRGLVANYMHMVGVPGADNAWAVGFLAGFPQSILNTPMDYVRLKLQLAQPMSVKQCYRGFSWVMAKEAASGAVFYGCYEGIKSLGVPGGIAGSSAALCAMTLTYPVDVFKTRVQAGETFESAKKMSKFNKGISWALAKCILSNFVALSAYELACTRMKVTQPVPRKTKVKESDALEGQAKVGKAKQIKQ
uniref:Mitochondrial carrier protein n=1 Tax=Pyramimonas obovata TaxID=1411642 RepID=A0A7S0N6S7_9CHLO|mmetsp:Transcript_20524/g.44881  ORF Transcript_20524/g.44881 Transcript_20524/m.44881 type:complete len:257 (+) Transcript_20524:382-1152(+)|eukprot:CAMPEP_0118922318 /NCGR_PEP_ID=MMETSP1169-20130426/1285_1 /TAXON_ID=36882 /ORGANISM="Pyramimonas obovata, Strain CCMP722" /LENGTH=256 /DNA_ID=CAMNT_0006863163 /DNA_START=375 /DNA_END=1145 /DNA_ORIENTATION=-